MNTPTTLQPIIDAIAGLLRETPFGVGFLTFVTIMCLFVTLWNALDVYRNKK